MIDFKHFIIDKVGETVSRQTSEIVKVSPKDINSMDIKTNTYNSKVIYVIYKNGSAWLHFVNSDDCLNAFKEIATYILNYGDQGKLTLSE